MLQESVTGKSVIRENLKITVSRDKDKFNAVYQLLKSDKFKTGSVIIYCFLKYDTEKLT